MRRDYTLTPLIIPIVILAFGLLLFGTLDATQIDAPDCNLDRTEWGCIPRGERPTCPNPNILDGCGGGGGKDTPKLQPKIEECDPNSECNPKNPTCPDAMDRFRERMPNIQLPDCSTLPNCPHNDVKKETHNV